jgi:hypothetical protein
MSEILTAIAAWNGWETVADVAMVVATFSVMWLGLVFVAGKAAHGREERDRRRATSS